VHADMDEWTEIRRKVLVEVASKRSHSGTGQSPFDGGSKSVDTLDRETEEVEISGTSINVAPDDERATACQGKVFRFVESGRRSPQFVLEMGSALEVDLPVTLEPSCPGLPNCRGKDEVIPEVEEHVNVYEITDIFLSTFAQYLFVDTGSIRSISQIVGQRGTAPSNVEWQLHLAGRLCESRFLGLPA